MKFSNLSRTPSNKPSHVFGSSVGHQLREALVPSVHASSDLEKSRLESLHLRRRPVAMATVIDLCTEVMGPFIARRGQNLRVTVEPAAMDLNADATRLCQVLRHIIANASMFSTIGAEIHLHAMREGDDAIVVVTDSGIGIESQRIESIFEPYLVRHDADNARRGGLGIGLHVARATMRAHDGSLVATSGGPGMGSAFTLRVPRRHDALEESAPFLAPKIQAVSSVIAA
jgi:signal transduction histidine kinase